MKKIPSEEQSVVIRDFDRDILLYASAGTGKTFTVAKKAAYAIESGYCTPEQILCLTFTVKAAKELREQISGECGAGVETETIHGFCYSLLRDAAKASGSYSVPAVIDETDADEFFRNTVLPAVEEEIRRAALRKRGYDPDVLAQCDRIVDGGRYLWATKNGSLDEAGETVYAPNAVLATRCPRCGEALQGFVCPSCGRDVRRAFTPICEPRVSPYRIISAIRHHRDAYGIYGENSKADYRETFCRMLEEEPDATRALFSLHRVTDESFLTFMKRYCGSTLNAYAKFLKDNNLFDFDDLIFDVIELTNEPNRAQEIASKYRLIVVDEVQDTSPTEYRILSRLFGSSRVLMCGDRFQSIYGWRGAKPSEVEALFRQERNPVLRELSVSRRSIGLLTAAAKSFRNGAPPVESADGERIRLCQFETFAAETEWLYGYLAGLTEEERASSCILVRTNGEASRIKDAFDAMPDSTRNAKVTLFAVDREQKWIRQPVVKDFFAFVRLIANPYDEYAFGRVRRYFPQLSPEVPPRGASASDFLIGETATGDLYEPLITSFAEGRCVVFDLETTGLDVSQDEAIQLAAYRIGESGVLAELNLLIRSDRPVSAGAFCTHGIDSGRIEREGVSKTEALAAFRDFSKGCTLVGHNGAAFDALIVRREWCECGMPDTIGPMYDTMTIAKRLLPEMTDYKLATLCDRFGIVNRCAHDAYADVEATARLLGELVKQIRSDESERKRYYGESSGAFERTRMRFADWRDRFLTDARGVADEIYETYFCKNDPNDALGSVLPYLCASEGLLALSARASLGGAESDAWTRRGDRIPVMTVHQAKGCEFDSVIVADVAEGIFPSYLSKDERAAAEERRLFYVAMTRAKRRLIFTYAKRMITASGFERVYELSSFLSDIPDAYLDRR